MPLYELVWSKDNGKGSDPTTHTTRQAGSTPEKAAENAVKNFAISAAEIEGFTLSYRELGEDE